LSEYGGLLQLGPAGGSRVGSLPQELKKCQKKEGEDVLRPFYYPVFFCSRINSPYEFPD
jgi:hypothetical protein